MKPSAILLAILVIAGSCKNKPASSEDISLNYHVSEIHRSFQFGVREDRSILLINYDKEGIICDAHFTEISVGDTIQSKLRMEYDDEKRISKIYRQILSDQLDSDRSEYTYLSIEYSNDEFTSLSYNDLLVKDFVYEDGLLKSLKIYFNNTGNSSFSTRYQELEYDDSQRIIGLNDTYISSGKLQADISITYDSKANPLYKSVLSMIPYFDVVSYLSPNNMVQVNSRNDNANVRDYTIEIEYSNCNRPVVFHTDIGTGMVHQDTIVYKTGSNK